MTQTRSATRSTTGTRGTSTPSRSRRSATSTTTTAGRCRRAGSTAPTTSRSTPAAARSRDSGRRRWRAGRHRLHQGDRPQRQDQPAPDGAEARGQLRVEDPAVEQRARAEPRADLLPGVRRRRWPSTSARRRWTEVRAGRTDDLDAVRGARRGRRRRVHRGGARGAQPPHGDPERQDRQLPPLPADAVERQRRATATARPGPTRTRCRTRRSSRRTRRTTSRASTSCGRCAASTRACRAESTCTPAAARWSSSCTRLRCRSSRLSRTAAGNGARAVDHPERRRPRGERRPGRTVVAVHVQVGRLSGVVPDAMRFCFEVAWPYAGRGCRLVIEEVDGRIAVATAG